jgi:hypothetical protein
MSGETEYPVHDELEIIDGETIFKSDGWWKAVVVCDSWNGEEVNVYLWQENDGNWNRKQKFKVDDKQEWLAVKGTIDEMVDNHL